MALAAAGCAVTINYRQDQDAAESIAEAVRSAGGQATAIAADVSAFALTQAVIPEMRDRRFGRIIFLSSMAAVNGGVVSTPYASSKAALLGIMHYYAAALIHLGITANAIAPALIENDMVSSLPIPSLETMPLGRLGRSSEVGDVARLLVECEYINGQTIHLNAGRYMT